MSRVMRTVRDVVLRDRPQHPLPTPLQIMRIVEAHSGVPVADQLDMRLRAGCHARARAVSFALMRTVLGFTAAETRRVVLGEDGGSWQVVDKGVRRVSGVVLLDGAGDDADAAALRSLWERCAASVQSAHGASPVMTRLEINRRRVKEPAP